MNLCDLTATKKPIITENLKDVHVKSGVPSAKFECKVSGDPEPTISWLADKLNASRKFISFLEHFTKELLLVQRLFTNALSMIH